MSIVDTAGSGAAPPRSLEPLAMTSLEAGRMLMEAGGTARSVASVVELLACGLGAERLDLRIGYASIAITVGIGSSGITRMRRVGALGVNQQLYERVCKLASRVSRGELDTPEAQAALAALAREQPRHPAFLTAICVGLACAAFGRLLSVDWRGSVPVFLAAGMGQYLRGKLLALGANPFLCAGLIALLTSMAGAVLARWAGCSTVTPAAVASVLLLVPGVPAVNAQSDILEGHPTLGSARAVAVAMTLVFISAGLWISHALLMLWGVL